MKRRRVVVTGLGVISPVGNNIADVWANVVAGKPNFTAIDTFDASAFTTRFAGQVRDFDASAYIAPKEARKIDMFIQYGIAACNEALVDCGIDLDAHDRGRIGVAMGAGIGGIGTIEANHDKFVNGGPRKISPFFVPGSIINMISGHVSMQHGLTGPNLSVVTACTTSTHSIGIGARTIAWGDADIMLAGGSEYASTPLGMGGFCSARAMSTRNDDPQHASRPFDAGRDGFVLSDGGGCLVLEDYDHARARGAHMYAELIGFGMSGDAYHITSPPEDGAGAAKSMRAAIADADIEPHEVDYQNAHATSTPVGDIAETVAIKSAFGEHAYKLAISGTKSTTGHLLGAAGAIEAIITVKALQEQVIPPTINLDDPDPACDLDYVPNVAREQSISVAASNSFGFGGTNGTLVFRTV